MLATIQLKEPSVFSSVVEKLKILEYIRLQFCLWFYMGVKLGEEHGLRMFENRVLRRIFGPKKNEVMGG
jgi:hypothetical protein